MLKYLWIGLAIIILIASFTFYSIFNHSEDYRHKAIINTMTESGQSAAMKSVDRSSRVSETAIILDQEIFESAFKEIFAKNNNVKLGKVTYDFKYLKDGANIKAIRVILTDDRGVPYQVTCVPNLKQGGD